MRGSFSVTDEHSKEETDGDEKSIMGRWSRMWKAVPPPRLVVELVDFDVLGKLKRVKPGGEHFYSPLTNEPTINFLDS